MVFLLARQSLAGESRIFGGDLITTNESGFFSLSYNQNNPSISSVQPSNGWTICVMGTSANTQNFWINGELMGSGSVTARIHSMQ